MRDYRKLRVFNRVDALVIEVYRHTDALQATERYGLQSQLRRAAVSSPTNIVEGSRRRSEGDYCRFLEISCGSAAECAYLLGLCVRLQYLAQSSVWKLIDEYERAQAEITNIIESFGETERPLKAERR